ncbi:MULTISPECIES: hypothetical protein [Acidovorax]|jgi:uncharacterized membrane protein|uniref:Uncharacterized protein n=2 Tax=Acidovorax carolinensis TaxID=553814 RepID=A0A240TW33_9BURK|nr:MULTISPECIES: hypothetical protein [Acidovorax]ART49374.1 hypothetical protein CBP33_15605 [Acidovorax carolinensis]ART54241.1 hypothetical protein CBP35_02840 [Acidovorax carolinensis]ART60134.1 hypothetical protein CBP36_16080 [Acidovorax carolinensis]
MDLINTLRHWQAIDRTRERQPSENLMVAGLGLALIAVSLRSERRGTAALQAAAGGALLVRAARGSRYLTRDPDPRLNGAWDAHLADARELGLD